MRDTASVPTENLNRIASFSLGGKGKTVGLNRFGTTIDGGELSSAFIKDSDT
jgi:hypothetical protein